MTLSDLLSEFHSSYTGVALTFLVLAYVAARGAIHAVDTALRIVTFVRGQIRRDLTELRRTWQTTQATYRSDAGKATEDPARADPVSVHQDAA